MKNWKALCMKAVAFWGVLIWCQLARLKGITKSHLHMIKWKLQVFKNNIYQITKPGTVDALTTLIPFSPNTLSHTGFQTENYANSEQRCLCKSVAGVHVLFLSLLGEYDFVLKKKYVKIFLEGETCHTQQMVSCYGDLFSRGHLPTHSHKSPVTGRIPNSW